MSAKTPIRATFNGSEVSGLAEYQSGEFIDLSHGGLGASLSIGTTGQVIKVNSAGTALEFGNVEAIVNIDNATDLTSSTLAASDQILLSDGGTEGRVTLSQLDTLFSGTTQTLTNKTLTDPIISNTIIFEGSTVNDYETTLEVTDPTADRTITFQNASGTVAFLSDVSGGGQPGAFTTLTLDNNIVFEGATADEYELTLSVADPTADRTVTIPDATGTIVLKDTTDTLTNKSISLTNNTLTGTLAEFNSALSDGSFASLAGTETLTNKTIDSADNTITLDLSEGTLTGTLSEFNSALSDGSFASLAGTETLTNKTLTSPIISTISNSGTLTLPTSTDTLVGRATTDTLTNKTLGATTIAGHLTPDTNETYDLGSSSFKFRDIYLSGTSINLGDATITADGSAIVLPANTTISGGDGAAVDLNSSQTLTNKTLTSAVLNTGVSGTAILDEDNMASDSATQLATQQSIKAYVDTEVGNVSTSSISQGDSNVTVTDSGTGAVTIDADGSTIITMNATTALDASGVTNAIRLPNGTTAQRPSGAVGEIRYNSSTDTIEGYTTAGGWAQLGATSSTSENTDDTATDSETAISTTAS